MKSLLSYIKEAEAEHTAIGHFNISDLTGLKGILEAVRELDKEIPVIIGVSEGEGNFIGLGQVAALIKSLREDGSPIFLNADHTRTIKGIEEAVLAGFDIVMFDGSRLAYKENIKLTKEAVSRAKNLNPDILVEGELGYIAGSSALLEEEIVIREEDLTRPVEAVVFAEETKIDLLAPSVGNIHGILSYAPNPALDIERIKEIKKTTNLPLVLHGGSGLREEEFRAAILAGVSIVHINTELRLAWRRGLEQGLRQNPKEITPYKILPTAVQEIKQVVLGHLRTFNLTS